MASSVAASPIIWNNVCLDIEKNAQMHSIFRSGQYACMFDNFYQSSRSLYVVDLETKQTIKRFKCELDEHILTFNYPYLVTKKDAMDRTSTIRVWDLTSSSNECLNSFDPPIRDIQRGVVKGKTLVLAFSDMEGITPKKIAIIKNIEQLEDVSMVSDDEIDPFTDLQIYNGWLIYSAVAGCLKMISLEDPSNVHYIPVDGVDMESYLQKITEDTILDLHEAHVIKTLVIEGDTCVGSTEKALKVWDLTSKTLQKTIERKDAGMLISLQGRFALESHHQHVRIWDIISGTIVHQEERTYPGNIPHLTHYNNTLFRVNNKLGQNWKDVEIVLPAHPSQAELANNSEKKKECVLI